MIKKAKKKLRNLIRSRPATSPIQSLSTSSLTPLPTHVPHLSPSTSNDAGTASPTGPLPDQSSSAPPVLSTSLQAPSSTSARPHESAHVTSESTFLTSTPPSSAQASSSKFATVAKDVFKTTLLLLNDALNGVPVPGKGAITATIRIIDIAEVRYAI
jgi:hypothetical protein